MAASPPTSIAPEEELLLDDEELLEDELLELEELLATPDDELLELEELLATPEDELDELEEELDELEEEPGVTGPPLPLPPQALSTAAPTANASKRLPETSDCFSAPDLGEAP